MSDIAQTTIPTRSVSGTFVGLAPLVAIVFLGFLAIGVPLPALSLYVHDRLGFSAATVGCLIGIQSLATVSTRHIAGTLSDRRGPKRAVLVGLPLAAASGILYLLSARAPVGPEVKLGILVLGRLAMGLGESLFITGAMSWGIGRLGPARTGVVMSWQGIAMYSALGLGAPFGIDLQQRYGFGAVAIVTITAPLVAAAIALNLAGRGGSGGGRVPFYRVLGLIWRPGLVLTLATMPFASLAAFLALDYAARGWFGAGLAMTAFGVGYVVVRLIGSHWPDRFGGATVAAVSLCCEALGQGLLWSANAPGMAVAGSALTGLGFSLVFPAMGVEATRHVAPETKGRAVGNFIAFFDVAMGITGPLVGLVVGRLGYPSAFLIGGGATLIALAFLPAVRRMKVA